MRTPRAAARLDLLQELVAEHAVQLFVASDLLTLYFIRYTSACRAICILHQSASLADCRANGDVCFWDVSTPGHAIAADTIGARVGPSPVTHSRHR